MPTKRILQDRHQRAVHQAPDSGNSIHRGLQNRILRILSGRKDVILETGEEQIRYHSYLPPLLASAKSTGAVETLVIVGSASDVQDIEDYARLLFPSETSSRRLIGIGSNSNLKNEFNGFSGLKGVIVGTPDRIIDHLRRENLDLRNIGKVVVDCPAEKDLPGFTADVQFIYSRTGIKPVTLVLTERLCEECTSLSQALRRPKVYPQSVWRKNTPQYRLYLHKGGGKANGPVLSVLGDQAKKGRALVLLKDRRQAEDLRPQIAGHGFTPDRVEIRDSAASAVSRIKDLTLVLFGYVPASGEVAAAARSLDDSSGNTKIVFVIDEDEYPTLSALQENMKVSMKKRDIPNDDAACKNLIADIVDRIKNEEDPHELAYYKKLIRKNVSIFLRGYFTAYLLKQIAEAAPAAGRKRNPAVFRNSARQEMATLFFGLGKNRKVFPRDISSLITALPEVDNSQIGDIKILDNYSFVEVAGAQAPAIIEKLNGMEFRGRKIIVNYARKKEDSKDS